MGDQANKRIMDQIPDTILKLLQEVDPRPVRILGGTPNSLLDPGDYLGFNTSICVKGSVFYSQVSSRSPDSFSRCERIPWKPYLI